MAGPAPRRAAVPGISPAPAALGLSAPSLSLLERRGQQRALVGPILKEPHLSAVEPAQLALVFAEVVDLVVVEADAIDEANLHVVVVVAPDLERHGAAGHRPLDDLVRSSQRHVHAAAVTLVAGPERAPPRAIGRLDPLEVADQRLVGRRRGHRVADLPEASP